MSLSAAGFGVEVFFALLGTLSAIMDTWLFGDGLGTLLAFVSSASVYVSPLSLLLLTVIRALYGSRQWL